MTIRTRLAAATKLLRWVHVALPGGSVIMVASKAPRGRFRAVPCQSIDAAVAAAGKVAATACVWFGLGVLESPPAKGRGRAEDVIQIGGVWADLDIEDGTEAHKMRSGESLPSSVEEALRALGGVVPAPSVVVHSGHGAQAYWLGEEPWRFAPGAPEPAAVLQGWHNVLAGAFGRYGWKLDSTFDLARIFRVPGTWNRKGEPVEVRILAPKDGAEPMRYPWDSLRALALTEKANRRQKTLVPQNGTSIRHSVADRIKAICGADKTFDAVWRRLRKAADQTSSAYHLSIAARLMRYTDWPDLEIVEALRLWNRQHGENTKKLERFDYLSRTLEKARSAVRGAAVAPAVKDGEALTLISQSLGMDVTGIVRMTGTPAQWKFCLGDVGQIVLTDSEVSTSAQPFRTAALGLGLVVRRYRNPEWDELVVLFAATAETVESGEEATHEGAMAALMDAFVAANEMDAVAVEAGNAAPAIGSFMRDGRLHFGLDDLMLFLRDRLARWPQTWVVQWLRSANYGDHRVKIGAGKKRRVWFLTSAEKTP